MASPVETTRAHVWPQPAAMLENCIPPVTATGLVRSAIVPSPCVKDGQTGVEKESQLGNSSIQQHLAGANTHSTSWPKILIPQHMASPVEATRAHVWRYPAAMLENCIPPVTATGLLRSVVVPSPCVRDGQTGVERESAGKFIDSTHILQEQTHTQLAGQIHFDPSTWPLPWSPPGHMCGTHQERCWRTASLQPQPRGYCCPWWCRRPA